MSEVPQEETRPYFDKEGKLLGHETFIQYRDRLLKEWQTADELMSAAKADEMEKRKALLSLFTTLKEGVNKLDLGGGWTLKLTHKVNYKLEKDRFKVSAVEEKIKKVGNCGPMLVDELVKVKYELGVSAYKKLDANVEDHKTIKGLVDEILTTEHGAPSVEITPPKDHKPNANE